MATQKVKELMTPGPLTMRKSATLREAAEAMRHNSIGGLCVTDDDGTLCGFVTDRDIVVRGIAQGQDPKTARLESVCTRDVVRVERDDDVDSVIKMMAGKAIRRIPVVDGQTVVGILSIGDLAQARDQHSALADISAAPPNL